MSLERFYNKLQLVKSRTSEIGQTMPSIDLNSISYDTGIIDGIEENVLNIESHFYNTDGQYLVSWYDIPYKYSNTYKDFLFDIPALFEQAGVVTGTYKISFAFLINLLGTNLSPAFFINEISADRTELKLRVKLSYVSLFPDIIDQLEKFKDIAATLKGNDRLNNLAINFGSNNIFQIVNLKVDCYDLGANNPCQYQGEKNCNELVVYVKLQYPLPSFIQEKQHAYISFKVLEDYIDTFTVKASEIKPEYNTLRGPRLDMCTTIETNNGTDIQTWNTLLDSDSVTANSLIREILSGSEQIPLNIDYTAFRNFVIYGSAEERVRNYNYKRELIDYYADKTRSAAESNASASFYVSKLTDNYIKRAQTVLTEFDDFEKYLHYRTGSLFTHDVTGSIIPAPKYVQGSKLINYSVTSSEYQAWYGDLLEQASKHDFRNYDSLYYNTPDHILRDPNNSEYVTFLHMIGQHFDNIYSYVRELTSIHRRDEHPERGIPNKLLPYYVRSLGWKIQNTKQLSDLWLYKLGVDQQGNYLSPTGSLVSQAHENLNHQIWRRTVNNLPYLLKTKGSERSVRALFSIYGIPFTLISVKEYGGPKVEDVVGDETPNLAQQRFHYFLNFEGSQSIEMRRRILPTVLHPDPIAPQTVEFRFKTAYTSSLSMSLWAIEEGTNRNTTLHNLELVHHTQSLYGVNTYGYLKYTAALGKSGSLTYTTVTGSLLPYFDNDAWTIRMYTTEILQPSASFDSKLYIESGKASEFIDSRVSLSSSFMITGSTPDSMLYGLGAVSSVTPLGHMIVLGGSSNGTSTKFSGSIHGYKEYYGSYSKNVFNEHILNPGSYHIDHYTGSFSQLHRYYPLGLDNLKHNHTTYTNVSSSQPDRRFSFDTTASFVGFTGTDRTQYLPATETYYQYIPSIGGNTPKSNKVRIENSTLTGMLSPDSKAEVSTFDKSKRDSNRLAIVFSPTDQINRDISNQFGPYNFESFFGDPQDGTKDYYPSLKSAREQYFKKFARSNDIGKYIEVFSLYDYTVFTQLKQLIPARANLITGVLIEPSILERPKVRRTFPDINIQELNTTLQRVTPISSSYIPIPPDEIDLKPQPIFERSKNIVRYPVDIVVETEVEKKTVRYPVNPIVETEIEKKTVHHPVVYTVETQVERHSGTADTLFTVQGERQKVQSRLQVERLLEGDRTKHTSSIEHSNEVLGERSKQSTYIQRDVTMVGDRSKASVSIPLLEYVGKVSSREGLPPVSSFKVRSKSYVPTGTLPGSKVNNTPLIYTYRRNGVTRTVSTFDTSFENIGQSIPTVIKGYTPLHSTEGTIGNFTVKVNNVGASLQFERSYLTSSIHIFTFTDYNVGITSSIPVTGPKFEEYLTVYNYTVKEGDNSLYLGKPIPTIINTVVTSSTTTPNIFKVVEYYSSSGEYVPEVTSPLMLTSPVYLSNRTGSKSRYQREIDYAINKDIGAYYSSSLQPVNYQFNQDSSTAGCRFVGSRLTGPDINVDSPNTLNGTPVVSVTFIEENPIRV